MVNLDIDSSIIRPDWPAPKKIQAYSTTRLNGVSRDNYTSFNLAYHVNDRPTDVAENRTRLMQRLALPQPPTWLDQIHGTEVITLPIQQHSAALPKADAAYSQTANTICTIMTADCLPILFCSPVTNEVAAAHAGWRGLCYGIIENTLAHFQAPIDQLLIWLGPAIGPNCFEVGEEVRQQFIQQDRAAITAFHRKRDRYLADLYLLAKQRLLRQGVAAANIYGGTWCTMCDEATFFSYRRDKQTGRMASLIWFADD